MTLNSPLMVCIQDRCLFSEFWFVFSGLVLSGGLFDGWMNTEFTVDGLHSGRVLVLFCICRFNSECKLV